MALLIPDPCDPKCPADFKKQARAALPRTLKGVGPKDEDLREALGKFIADFADWNKSADTAYLNAAHAIVRAAHGSDPPLVVDPFAGGGSIPLEALRVGCDAFASDLNPVAALIQKTLLVRAPNHPESLSVELRRLAREARIDMEKVMGEFYPKEPGGSTVIAYVWTRTVACEAPNCGAEIPLMSSFWLSKKQDRRRAFKAVVSSRKGGAPEVNLRIFVPKNETEVAPGNVRRAKATCLACGSTLAPDRVRANLASQRGGADVVFSSDGNRASGARLLSVVVMKDGSGREFREPTPLDYEPIRRAQAAVEELAHEVLPNGLSLWPTEPTPTGGGAGAGRAFSIQKYGMATFADMFTARQKMTLRALLAVIGALDKYSDPAREIAGLAISRYADIANALCQWENTKTQVRHLFTRQALPMLWDFAEAYPLGDAAGAYAVTLLTMVSVIENVPVGLTAEVQVADACTSPLPDASAAVWFTDPPYYDAIPYSDLSDFFYVWLRRALPNESLLRDPADPRNPLTPKSREVVQDETRAFEGRPKDRQFFEERMARAFAEGRRVLQEDGVGCVVFAHKTTEGWEALLSGMVRSGWVITGSWPIATESGTRLRARESAALSTSVHLVCRPRAASAPVGDWADVAHELPIRVRAWMDRLDREGIRGADLVFACIGPAMEVYSRYSKVVDAEDREIPLGGDPTASEPHKKGFLAKVWEVVGRLAVEQVLGKAGADGTALEEDARLTALFLWALQGSDGGGHDEPSEDQGASDDGEDTGAPPSMNGGSALPFDVVRRFAQPLGIHLETWEDRIIHTEKGVVRLLPVGERMTQLFGAGGAEASSEELRSEAGRAGVQLTLFPEGATASRDPPPSGTGKRAKGKVVAVNAEGDRARPVTTLDRVHAAMLLQRSGQTTVLRSMLAVERRRGSDFERLSNALAALYPRESEERRLVEAMLLSMPN